MVDPARWLTRMLCCSALALALSGCGGTVPATNGPQSSATSGPAAAAATPTGQTFGTQPCGKLISFEEIVAAIGQRPALVDIVSEYECDYEDQDGHRMLAVLLRSDPSQSLPCTAPDGTYLGEPVEAVTGLGDSAVWSPSSLSLCFIKGSSRVQILLTTQMPDPKAAITALANKAVGRLP